MLIKFRFIIQEVAAVCITASQSINEKTDKQHDISHRQGQTGRRKLSWDLELTAATQTASYASDLHVYEWQFGVASHCFD